MKGRRSKSAAAKELAGNPGKRAIGPKKTADAPDADAEIAAGEPEVFFSEPPDVLNDAAKAIWHGEIKAVMERVILLPQGMRIFTMYCSVAARWEELEIALRTGTTYETKTGFLRERPEVRQRDRAFNDMMKLAEQLNLSPKSWIQSMATFQARQMDLFAKKPAGLPAAANSNRTPDKFDAFIASRPPVH